LEFFLPDDAFAQFGITLGHDLAATVSLRNYAGAGAFNLELPFMGDVRE
jgi:hypothetical protein